MALPHPRTQTVIIFSICALAVLATAYYNGVFSPSKPTFDANIASNGQAYVQTPIISADLKAASSSDWQKDFLGSGGAKNNTGAFVLKTTSASSTEALTLTDQFGRKFFVNYLTLKQSGGIKDAAAISAAADQMVTSGLYATQAKKYSISNIIVRADISDASLRSYTTSVNSIISQYSFPKNEAMIAQEALSLKTSTKLTDLNPLIAAHTRIVTQLLALSVPSTLKQQHIDLINGFSTMKFVGESLRDSEKDPLKGIIGTNTYLEGTAQIVNALKDMRDTLATKGVTFDPSAAMLSTLLNIQAE